VHTLVSATPDGKVALQSAWESIGLLLDRRPDQQAGLGERRANIAASQKASAPMIVCSCNVLSDHDVRDAVKSSESLPRSPKQLYGCLGCSAECGRCARTIKGIIDEALGACAQTCQAGCPHSHIEDDTGFALAAS
jgi:bacterioferritin-associated ferredoxin